MSEQELTPPQFRPLLSAVALRMDCMVSMGSAHLSGCHTVGAQPSGHGTRGHSWTPRRVALLGGTGPRWEHVVLMPPELLSSPSTGQSPAEV